VHTGVKVIVVHEDKVLFVHHSYGRKEWTLPGGGVKRKESVQDAARREVREEVGIQLDTVTEKGSFLYEGEGKKVTIFVFTGEAEDLNYTIDNFEIQDASWEDISSLTLSKSPVARKCFEVAGYSLKE
jgi:8-oxo-dGTP pyrophosphatase MutT (NUDIX family)